MIFNWSRFNLKVSNNFLKCLYRSISNKSLPGHIIDLGSHKIHYELIGHGKNHLFLFPGLMGSTRTDWGPQLETLDKDKFTILAWDAPGYGYSSPPSHALYADAFHRDAMVAGKLMKALDITKASLMGWCGGGVHSIIAAHQNSEIVDKLILVETFVNVDDDQIKIWKGFRDINSWSPAMRDPMIDLYGAEVFQSIWNTTLDMTKELQKLDNGDLCREELQQLSCPTLVIHCPTDPWVPIERGRKLARMIKNSRLVEFEGGNHCPHLARVEQFNKVVQDFLLE